MEKRQDIEKQLEKIRSSKGRIEDQIKETESSIKQLQGIVNNEMMETGSSDTLNELSHTREKLISLQQTLQYANGQIIETQQQLTEYDRIVLGGQIQKLDQALILAVVDLQEKIGEAGLKGQLDKLGSLIIELGRLSSTDVKVHDVDQHLNTARALYNGLSSSLFDYWKRIEGLKWGPAHSTNPVREDYQPGFGVTPR
jgi:chromosome segregation ATPase